MENHRIKTYSRKAPVAVFKSSAVLVPSYPDPAANVNVRESRLNDETLVVDVFEDTFDRIATGVVIPPSKNLGNHSDDSDNSNDDKSSDFFKKPSETPNQRRKNWRKSDDILIVEENFKFNQLSGKLRQIENKTKAIPKKITGIKRKKIIDASSNEDDSGSEINQHSVKSPKVKKPKRQTRKVINKKKKISRVKDKKELEEYAVSLEKCDDVINTQDSRLVSHNTSSFIDEHQKSRETFNTHQRNVSNDFPTSTPRDNKLRMIVNMQNLSPITLNKECLSIGDVEQDSKENYVLRGSNLNDKTHASLKESIEFVKPKSRVIKSKVQRNKSERNAFKRNAKRKFDEIEDNISVTKENMSENNSSVSELLIANTMHNNESTHEHNNILGQIPITQTNTQFLNVTPLKNIQKSTVTASFIESPLLFDDSQNNQSVSYKDYSPSQNKISKISKDLNKDYSSSKKSLEAFDEDEKSTGSKSLNAEKGKGQKGNADESINESSFSPHEWSNDYDSSYEYFADKDTNNSKKLELSLNDISAKTNDVNATEESFIISGESTEYQNNRNSEIKSTIISSEVLQSGNKENSFVNGNEINNVLVNSSIINENIEPICEIVNEDTNLIRDGKSDDNLNSLELQTESNHLNTQNESPIQQTQRNLRNEKAQKNKIDQLIDHLEGALEENNEINILDKDDQTVECSKSTIFTTISTKEQSHQNQEMDERLNGQKLIVRITKLSPNYFKASHILSTRASKSLKSNQNIIKKLEKKTKEKILNKNNKNIPIDVNILDTEDTQNKVDSDDQINIITRDTTYKTTSTTKISDENEDIVNRLHGKELVPHIVKLDDQNLENVSPILSRRVSKNRTYKGTTKKSIKKINKKKGRKESYKNNAIDVVENKNLHTENKQTDFAVSNKINKIITCNGFETTNSEKNPDKNEKLGQIFETKELHVLVSKLPDSDPVNESPILSRRSIKQPSKKSALKKLQSNTKIKDKIENDIENTNIANTITNNIINTEIKEDRLFNSDEDVSSKESVVTGNEQNTTDKSKEINTSLNGQDLCDMLSKLNDPVKITMRRNVYKKLERPLTAITEDLIEQPSRIDEEEEGENSIKSLVLRKENSNIYEDPKENSLSEEYEVNKSMDDVQIQPIFLKPGKSWARSLSIISHFHSGQNLEELAIGRGKNWRHSVQTILDMQSEGAIQSITRKNVEERDVHSHSFIIPVAPQKESNRVSSIVTSPSRFSRFSMRIIPSGKRSTLTDDFIYSQRSSSLIADRTRKASITRKTSLKIRRDTLIETEDDLIRSARDIILKRCKQTTYTPFDVCFPDSYINHCRKIGEGVYGEVFLYANDTEKSVIKIIPIEGDELVNCEPQKKFHEILSEIIISEELHKLRVGNEYNTDGFVGVNRIMCVIGQYPNKLIELWNVYDEEKNSENDCPSVFGDEQLYIILELAHGGQDLEAYVFQNASESYSIFLQTAFTLAVAEQSLQFEHRDLHWGNILISKSDDTDSTYKLGHEEISLPTKGVQVSIIDFTLSRMSYLGCKIFNDLAADPTLFTAQGEYQFDIYRMMRDNVNNDWQQFNPFTNVLWLDYTLDKMITAARYKRKTSKIHKTAIEQMKELRKEILSYKSAFDFVSNCDKIAAIIR